jgi:curved DNA-binding protein CbpA
MTKTYENPYTLLGVLPTATAAEIKRAYFEQVRANPPERAPELFKQIRAAYERLNDPKKRVETDMLLLKPWPKPGRKRRATKVDLTVHPEDVLIAATALTDLERTDWHEHYRKVEL